MLSIVPEEDAALRDLMFLTCASVTPERVVDHELFHAKNVWYPSSGQFENFLTHTFSQVSQGFECALENMTESFRYHPHELESALSAVLYRLKAGGVTPVKGQSDPFLLFNVSSEDNAAYFAASWPHREYFVVIVYARQIDRTVLANIVEVDQSLSRLIQM